MAFDEGEVEQVELGLGQRALPGELRALELDDVALAHGQEVVDVLGGAEGDRLLHAERGLHVGQDHGGGAVGHRRAVGALQRPRHERVLVRGIAAELVGELLLEVRIGILGAVLVRLYRDLGEGVGLVAVALEIGRGDLAEDAGEARLDVGLFGDIRGLDQHLARLRAVELGHLLDAHHQHEARLAGGQRVQPHVDRGRAGGAGILDPRAGLEAQVRVRLQRQGGVELLAHEAAIHVADIDDVDVLGLDASVGDSLAGGLHDQRFAGLAVELAEFSVGPSDDTGSHGTLLRDEPRFWRATLDAAAWRVESASTCIYTYIAWPSSQPSPQEICSWRPGYRLGPAQIPPLNGY